MSKSQAQRANEPIRRTEPGKAGGVLDTIADGFSIVLERPYLMLLPLVLDLILWLVVQVSLQPLAEDIASFMESSATADGELAAEGLRAASERVEASDALTAFLPSIFSGIPVDTFFNSLVMALSPNAAFGIDREAMFGTWGEGLLGVWTPESSAAIVLIGLGCLILSSMALVLYRVPLARTVRGDTSPGIGREIVKARIHFVGYLLLLLGFAVASFVPLLLASAVFLILGFNLIFVLTIALFVFGGMVSIYSLFIVDAILLHRIGPVQAISMSMSVGREYFSQVTRFALTGLLLSIAALHLWSTIVVSIPGIVTALVVNAFLGTGLSLASMLFYSDRFRLIKAARRQSRPSTEASRVSR